MVDLLHNSLNFLMKILDQIKAIYACINSVINDLYHCPSNRGPSTEDVPGPGLFKPKVIPRQDSEIRSLDVSAVRNQQDRAFQDKNRSSEFDDELAAIPSTTADYESATEDCNLINISGAPTEFHAVDDSAIFANNGRQAQIAAQAPCDASAAASTDLIVAVSQPIHKRLCGKYDRAEICEKAWKMPIFQAAKELGVSEKALSNACVRLYIPTPGSSILVAA